MRLTHDEGTTLHPVKQGRADILKNLLEKGANTTHKDHRGRTPLDKFLETKDMKLVQALKDTRGLSRKNPPSLPSMHISYSSATLS